MIICQQTRGVFSSGADQLVLDLPFSETKSLIPRSSNLFTSGTLSFSRASSATFIGSNGQIQTVTDNTPRFYHDPFTLECKGLLIEKDASNLIYPSISLTNQTVNVSAVFHTLSFYGTGTVALSGAYTATVVGAGAYPNRTTFTFYPSAGSLTLTVTGTVQYAQLEANPIATSYIPTTTGPAVRSADTCSVDIPAVYRDGLGTVLIDGYSYGAASATWCSFDAAASGNRVFEIAVDTQTRLRHYESNVTNTTIADPFSTPSKFAYARDMNGGVSAYNGNIGSSSLYAAHSPDTIRLGLGTRSGAGYLNGCISSFRYYRKRLPNAKLQALTAP